MLAAALLMAWVPGLFAQSDPASKYYSLSIARGSLASALDQFSKQTGLQYGAELKTPEIQQRLVGPVIGRITAGEALTQLLEGTDLAFAWEDEFTVRIYPSIVRPHAEDNVQEVLVTGSRLSSTEGPAPVRVYSHGKIERYGVSTLSNLTRYITQQPFSFGESSQSSGSQHFQMRGLGFDTTLVLINGRRAQTSANSILVNAFDLNTIPLTAVDRIEVMSDSASAIYGADAIGGVVNIILKESVQSPEIYLHYGGAEGGSGERRVAGSIGSAGERFKSSLVIDYFERDFLIGKDRDLWRNQDFRRFGGQDYRVSTANPANVYSLTGRPLPGLSTTQASVPSGSTGVGLTPADFIATAGVRSLESPYELRSIDPESRRLSGFGSAALQLKPKLSVFGELLVADSRLTTQRNLPLLSREVIPASNPYNPFGEAVAVDYLFAGMEPISTVTDSDLLRAVSGARGGVSKWDWELAVLNSDERVTAITSKDIDRTRVRAALQSTDPQTALNLFGDGPAGSADLLSSLIGKPQKFDFSSGSLQVSGFMRGPLFQMPGGITEFVIGGEWRREDVEFLEAFRVERDRDVTSAFAEIKFPLLDELSVQVALRGDYYEHISDTVNPQYGIVWRPAKDWLVRAAYGTSFRPPSLLELYAPRQELAFPVADPRRGGAVSTVRLLVGGNPDLDVVTAQSFTTGFEFAPAFWRGARVGSSYWRVVMDSRVIVPQLTEILKDEDRFPGRVNRSAATAEDLLAGRPGALASLDISRLNYGRLETSGIDVDLSYLIEGDGGCFQAALRATWVDEYLAQDLTSALPQDRVGIANAQGTIPAWRLVGTLTWKRKGWGATATATFAPHYQDSNLTGPIDRRLPSQTLVDTQAWLELGSLSDADFLGGSKLTVGVLNVLDEEPNFANAGFVAGYDLSQADLTQRFAYLRFTKAF